MATLAVNHWSVKITVALVLETFDMGVPPGAIFAVNGAIKIPIQANMWTSLWT